MKVTERAQARVRGRLRRGATAIDATVGNGHDTVFLAAAAGPGGLVIGFDIQEAAIEETRRRVGEAAKGGAALARVDLHAAGHERMREFTAGPVGAVMFNLGYLPGSDKRVVTRPGSTVEALAQAAGLLEPGGVITLVIYRGHSGGREEEAAVAAFCGGLDVEIFVVEKSEAGAESADAPCLVTVEKRGES